MYKHTYMVQLTFILIWPAQTANELFISGNVLNIASSVSTYFLPFDTSFVESRMCWHLKSLFIYFFVSNCSWTVWVNNGRGPRTKEDLFITKACFHAESHKKEGHDNLWASALNVQTNEICWLWKRKPFRVEVTGMLGMQLRRAGSRGLVLVSVRVW